MANVVRDPKEHPDAIIPDLSKPDPLVTFRRTTSPSSTAASGSSAISQKVGDDYFPLPAPVGRHASNLAPYFVRERDRLVGAVLSGGQHAASHRPAVRRLPFGQLQHPDQGRHRMERRLREMPRPRQRARCAARRAPTSSIRRASITSRANDVCIQCHSQGQPLTNPIDGKYYDWPVGFHVGLDLSDLLEARRAQARRDDLHALRRRHRAQEPDAGQRFRAERDVHARRHLLQLPRRARHRQQRRPAEARQRHVPGVPRSRNRPTVRTPRPSSSTRTTSAGSSGNECVACHMPKIEQTIGRRQRPQPHLPLHLPRRERTTQNPERVHRLPHRQDPGMGAGQLKSWTEISPWRMAN